MLTVMRKISPRRCDVLKTFNRLMYLVKQAIPVIIILKKEVHIVVVKFLEK